ncbi:hypothetical protein [Kitasatospora sp. NPDC097643]|uniref:hypothetical protein n=1 Tax=Kitasatospora sp. NPDC097643 TaxID=3157230 RepID=UPI0033341CF4
MTVTAARRIAGVVAAVAAAALLAGCTPAEDRLMGVALRNRQLVVLTGLCPDERASHLFVDVTSAAGKRSWYSAAQGPDVRPAEVDLAAPGPQWPSNDAAPGEVDPAAEYSLAVEAVKEHRLHNGVLTVSGSVLLGLTDGQVVAANGRGTGGYRVMTAGEFEAKRRKSC